MSRLLMVMAVAMACSASPLAAQDSEDEAEPDASATETVSPEEVLKDSESYAGPPLPRECQSDPLNNTVVICAPRDDAKFRVREGIDWRTVDMKGDTPRAPDVFGIPDHGVVVARGCFVGPCPPEQPIIIDLEAIPEAPPGSDADRVGRGLAPRGHDGGSGLPDPADPDEAPETADD